MKKYYVLLVALFLVNSATAQWFPQNSGTTNNLCSVYFTDVNIGYAVGDSGTILKTTDGGLNWVAQNSGFTGYLYSVHFPSADRGYVVGEDKTLLKTINGGVNWTQRIIDTNFYIRSIYFTSVDTGYAAGSSGGSVWEAYGIIMKTIDGGNNWTNIFTYPHHSFNDVFFPSDDTGYVMGRMFGADPTGIILKTYNGGIDWTVTMIQECPYSLCMLTVNTGFAVTNVGTSGNNLILKTTDGWINWTAQEVEWWWNSIFFTSGNVGYGIGQSDLSNYDLIIKTTDGGINWDIQDSVLYFHPISVYFPSIDTGYIVGYNGNILKTTNGGGLPVGINHQPLTTESLKIYPNPTFSTITISTPTTPQKNTTLTIYNLNGQQLLMRQITEQQSVVDVAGLPQGVYFVRVADDRTTEMRKFIKQ